MKIRIIFYLFITGSTLAQAGCSTMAVVTDRAHGAIIESAAPHATLHRWFLGYVWNHKFLVNCPSHSLQRVELRTKFWEGLVSVSTLGIYAPVDIKWVCAPIPPSRPIHTADTTSSKAH